MPTYRYKAKKDPEHIVEAELEASSEYEAIERLNQMGLIPVSVRIAGSRARPQAAEGWHLSRVKPREVTIFTRQLSSLLKSGVPILRAIRIIMEQSENRSLQEILLRIHAAVKEGSTFSQALGRFPRVFPPLYIALIRTGEDAGGLPEALLRIADYRRKEEEMAGRVRMAMAYPLLMAVVGLATVVFMLTFVMPRLMKLYLNMEQAMPLPTRILIGLSQGLRAHWGWIVIAIAAALVFFRQQASHKAGKLSLSIVAVKVPLFGKLILKVQLARFCRTLELLLKSGIPILRAIEISLPVLDNEIIKRELAKSYKELEQGGSFGRSLKQSSVFPVFMTNLISVGEESGKLGDSLGEVATSYERDTDEALGVMGSLLEPLMILVMGIIVGFIVMAMLLPIFQINTMIG
jgi:type II secretory pathway component PulF